MPEDCCGNILVCPTTKETHSIKMTATTTSTLTTWKRRRKSRGPPSCWRRRPATERLQGPLVVLSEYGASAGRHLLLLILLSSLSFLLSLHLSNPGALCSNLVQAADAPVAASSSERHISLPLSTKNHATTATTTANSTLVSKTTATTAINSTTSPTTITQATTVNQQTQDSRRRQKVKLSNAQARGGGGRLQQARAGQTRPDQQQQQQQKQANKSGPGGSNNLWRPTKSFRLQQEQDPSQLDQQQTAAGPSRPPSDGSFQESPATNEGTNGAGGGLQVSITPRVSLVRVPVESNTILKCLISAQLDNFTRPFKVRWSRFMYDENVYEQIESSPGFDLDDNKPQEQLAPDAAAGGRTNGGAAGGSRLRSKRDDEQQEMSQSSSAAADQAATSSLSSSSSAGWLGGELDNQPAPVLLDRQQQLRDFLSRSRQETNVISNILIEATLSISPVKASDNATYYCTATDGAGLNGEQNQARVDLVALSQPVLRLDRVWPARDSKSALIYWTIVSDGNTPIKRTILMVRNDSQALIDAARRLHNNPLSSTRYGQQQQSWGASSSSSSGDIGTERQSQQQQQQQQQHSSIVLDNERNQWHRIEISGDGTDQLLDNGGAYPLAPLQQPEAARESALPDDNVVRVDMDVTSIGGGSIGSNSNPLSPYSNPVATNGGDDRHQAGGPMGRWRPRLKRKQRAFNLTSLLPGVTYQLRLAAINDMGQSNWTQLQATMPNEIPAQIQDIVVLSTTNDSITIGWRRPPYDNAKTIRYELQLFDLNRTLTLDANTNTNSSGAMRTNFMFHFVNLNPGTDYHFHIRACSLAGCSAYSSPKLLASTLDGEPDEPLDVELVCQWAGGSGAPPEAPATGSGGTQQASGQQQQHSVPANSLLSVSWLPPVNVRGKLLNYSVIIESSARYLNKSGQWASDEWRTTIDTGDNHTLSLEASNLLTPNTNYTARVCANNRSRKCGRPSQLTPKSQCSTPAELPAELPGNIQLALKQVQLTDIDMDRQQVETLVLELPFISLRNGTIDCIQIVLVRLPPSFDNSHRALTDLLPDDPAELKLQEYLELDNNNRSQQEKQASNEDDDEENGDGSDSLSGDGLRRTTAAANTGRPAGGSPLAYLAEELSPVNQSGSLDEISQGMKQILLGDGTQMTCHSVWARLQTSSGGGGAHNEQPVPTHQTATEQSHESRSEKMRKKKKTMKLMGRPNSPTRPVRPIDGPLLAQTYYSGFLRLVQLRQTSGPTASNTAIVSSTTTTSGSGGGIREARTRRQLIEGTNVELVTKFSNYFSPIKTGDRVPEVSIQSLLESEQRPVGDEDGGSGWWSTNNEIDDDQALAFRANSSFCAFKLVVWVQEKLGTSNRSCLVVTGFAETARRNLVRLFKLSTSYLNERLKLANETGQNGQGKSSMATMQPLEIGLMLIVSTLLVMFVIYLFLLPARLNRKRKLQLKRKLQQHENAIVQQQQQQLGDSGCGGTGGGIISSPSHQLEVDQTGGFIQATAPGGNMLSVAAHQDGQLGQASQGQPLLVHSASRQQLEPQCQQHSSPQSQHNHQSSSSFVANNNTLGYHQQHVASVHQQSPQQQQQQPHHHHHHHHPATSAGGTLRRPNQECPVHSSPMSQLNDTHPLSTAMANSSTTSSQHHSQHHLIRQQEQDGQCNGLDEHQEAHHHTTAIHKDRRQSVHVCQPVTSSMQQQQQQVIYGHHNAPGGGGHHHHHHAQAHQHQHHHQQHHHQSAYQLNGGASGLEFDEDQQQHGHRHVGGVMDQRNCRTMTRHRQLMADDDFGLDRSSNAPVPAEFGYKTLHHHHHPHQHNQQAAYSIGPHNHHHPHHHHQHNQQQQAIASMDYIAGSAATMRPTTATTTAQWNQTLARQQSTVLALAKKINKSIPLALFQPVMEIRLKNNWLREEYEQLPRSAQQQQQQQIATGANMNSSGHHSSDDGRYIKLRPQLIVSRDDSVSALIIGNHQYDASLVKLQVPVQGGATAGIGGGGANGLGGGGCAIVEKQFICAKSPVDPNTVWDFWRLIYEKEVNTLVMLTPNEDVHTGELRCAQYWPTCDNEVTTILSPRNDSVAQSKWPLAKFKICQETLSGPEADTSQATGVDAPEFVIRRLTLLVMATKASENEHLNAAPSGATSTTAATPTATIDEQQTNMAAADKQAINKAPATNGKASSSDHQMAHDEPAGGEPLEKSLSSPATDQLPPPPPPEALPSDTDPDHVDENNNNNNDQDDEVIVERNLLHFQFLHWNASSLSNQMKLIKFIELVNEQHAQLMQQQASPGANWQQISPQNPILVHCANGIGRSGLFTAMSFVIDDLSYKLASLNASVLSRASVGGGGGQQQQQQQQVAAKLNLFQLVSRLRNHRDMLLSPYRFYELLYQLTAKCIPAHISNQDQQQQQQQQQQLKSRFVNN